MITRGYKTYTSEYLFIRIVPLIHPQIVDETISTRSSGYLFPTKLTIGVSSCRRACAITVFSGFFQADSLSRVAGASKEGITVRGDPMTNAARATISRLLYMEHPSHRTSRRCIYSCFKCFWIEPPSTLLTISLDSLRTPPDSLLTGFRRPQSSADVISLWSLPH